MAEQSPFLDYFKVDPCLVSVCSGPNNKTVMDYAYTPLYAVYQYMSKYEHLGPITQEIRECTDAARRSLLKSTLPYMLIPSLAEFRKTEHVVRPTGNVVLDIDHMRSFEEAKALKQELFNDPELMPKMVFISPSGLGVKALMVRPLSAHLPITEAHRINQTCVNALFNRKYAQKYGVTADPQGTDLVRCCNMCYDPEILFRA